MESTVPFVSLYDQLDRAFATMQIENMKSVEHEDDEYNDNFEVDPLANPRLDKMDLFNLVDTKDRDKIMSASPSFVSSEGDFSETSSSQSSVSDVSADSGSGE